MERYPQSPPPSVIHGFNAVAELKPLPPTAGRSRNDVIHGFNAVAELKHVFFWFVYAAQSVIHGFNAVAELKRRTRPRPRGPE